MLPSAWGANPNRPRRAGWPETETGAETRAGLLMVGPLIAGGARR